MIQDFIVAASLVPTVRPSAVALAPLAGRGHLRHKCSILPRWLHLWWQGGLRGAGPGMERSTRVATSLYTQRLQVSVAQKPRSISKNAWSTNLAVRFTTFFISCGYDRSVRFVFH